MEPQKQVNKENRDDCEDAQDNTDGKCCHLGFDLHPCEEQAELSEHEGQHDGEAHEKQKEVFIISFPHAVPNPGAVVVEPFHAHVALEAVGGPWRPEDEASGAEF